MVEAPIDDFEQIVRNYQRRLYGFARRIVLNREDAEEIVQDAFVRAHRALNAMSPGARNAIALSPWLHTITLNVARNRLRKKRLQIVSLDAIANPDQLMPRASKEDTPESALDEWLDRQLVASAILEVPKHLQATARLRFLDGLTHAEIAERFAEPVGTIQSRVFRAVRLIRNILEAHRDAA
jgi:RNA polymerase sigma-70 factor, ECF subfamily